MNPFSVNHATTVDPALLAAWTAEIRAAVEVNRKRPSRDSMREAIARGMERRGLL